MRSSLIFTFHSTFQVFVTFFCLTWLSTCSQEVTFTTQTTQCSIIFANEVNEHGQPQLIFNKCTRSKCMKNLVNGVCSFYQYFQLEQKQCYRECCGESSFNEEKCRQFNVQRAQNQSQRDRVVILALTISLVSLFIALLIFLFFYLKFNIKEGNQSNKQLNYQGIQWKNGEFPKNKICPHCGQTDPYIRLNCGDYYHMKCLKDLNEWQCQKCKKPIHKTRVFCNFCREKFIKINGDGPVILEERILQSLIYHNKNCFDEFRNEIGVELKPTQSTQQ